MTPDIPKHVSSKGDADAPTVVMDLANWELVERFYKGVYSKEFSDESTADGLATWHRLLQSNASNSVFQFSLVLAPEGQGGLVLMHFLQPSEVTLATFLVVDVEQRGMGLGKRLLAEGVKHTRDLRRRLGHRLPLMIVAEVDDFPRILAASAQHPALREAYAQRLSFLASAGFLEAPVRYQQPALSAGTEPVEFILLDYVPNFQGDRGHFDVQRYAQFLKQFYGHHQGKSNNDQTLSELVSKALALPSDALERKLLSERIEAAKDPTFGLAQGQAIHFLAFVNVSELLHVSDQKSPGHPASGNGTHTTCHPRVELDVDALRQRFNDQLSAEHEARRSRTRAVESCHKDICTRPDPVVAWPATFVLDHPTQASVARSVRIRFAKPLVTEWSGKRYTLRASDDAAEIYEVDVQFIDSITVFPSGHLCYRAGFFLPKQALVRPGLLIAMQSLLSSAGLSDEALLNRFRASIEFQTVDAPASAESKDLRGYLHDRLQELLGDTQSILRIVLESITPDISQNLERLTKKRWRCDIAGERFKLEWGHFRSVYTELIGLERHDRIAKSVRTLTLGNDDRFIRLVAGLAQNVLAFDVQGEAEVIDSLRALVPPPKSESNVQNESNHVIFAAPGRFLACVKHSRSFMGMLDRFGGCPYRFLAFTSCAYNDLLLDEAANRLRLLLAPSHVPGAAARRSPVRRLRTLKATSLGERQGLLASLLGSAGSDDFLTLDDQFDSDYSLTVHVLPNLFRYEEEREVFRAYGELSDWSARSARVQQLSELVRDARSELQDEHTKRFEGVITLLLGGIGAVQGAGVFALLWTHFGYNDDLTKSLLTAGDHRWLVYVGIALALLLDALFVLAVYLLYAAWRRRRIQRRQEGLAVALQTGVPMP